MQQDDFEDVTTTTLLPVIGNVDDVSKKDPTTLDVDSIAKQEEFNMAPGK